MPEAWSVAGTAASRSANVPGVDYDLFVTLGLRKAEALSIRFEVESSKPLGIATWCTTAALRNIKYRKL